MKQLGLTRRIIIRSKKRNQGPKQSQSVAFLFLDDSLSVGEQNLLKPGRKHLITAEYRAEWKYEWYMEKHSTWQERRSGTSGYVGRYEEGGQLTGLSQKTLLMSYLMRDQPYPVYLIS